MSPPVEQHMFVDFVAENRDGPIADTLCELIQIILGRDAATGILRAVDDDEPSAIAQGPPNVIPIEPECRRRERNANATSSREADGRLIRIVSRIEDDGFIAGADRGLDGVKQR